MQVETHVENGQTITFIVPDNDDESFDINRIALIGEKIEAIIIEDPNYKYPYIKLFYLGMLK